jgi:PBP1b-binding outer membrane lipoprotein LpoB
MKTLLIIAILLTGCASRMYGYNNAAMYSYIQAQNQNLYNVARSLHDVSVPVVRRIL